MSHLHWIKRVPVKDTFLVREHKKRQPRISSGKSVTISEDKSQIFEVDRISYSSSEDSLFELDSEDQEELEGLGRRVSARLSLLEEYLEGKQYSSCEEDDGDDQRELLPLHSDLTPSSDEESKQLVSLGLPTSFGKAEHIITELEEPEEVKDEEILPLPKRRKAKKSRCQNVSTLYTVDEVLSQKSAQISGHTIFSESEAEDAIEKEIEEGETSSSSPSTSTNTSTSWSHEEVMAKYRRQRYSLWSRFDEGIWMDTVGWYSVTPEPIASHLARRCPSNRTLMIWDPFGGLGGNAIQFALEGHHVICSDINQERLAMARHNAKIYGVEEFIDFIHGDYFKLASRIRADLVFLSPPWGGPSYLQAPSFDVCTMMDIDGIAVLKVALSVAPNVIYFLPKNSSIESIARLFADQPERRLFEVEENRLDGRPKSFSVYYGPLFHSIE